MKIKKNILNDMLERNIYKKNEFKIRVIKILTRLKIVNFFNLLHIMLKMKKISFFCKINNKCYITSRSKSVCNKVKLSRIKFKELVNNGLLIGFNKYNW
jgi:ribosomal protein S14